MTEVVDFAGKYKFVRNEFMDEYLAANGANWIIRKMANNSSPSMVIEQNGNTFCIKLVSMGYDKISKFTVGEEFEETQSGGDVFNVTSEWVGSKLVLTMTPKVPGKGKLQKMTRELNGDEFILTLEVDDIVAKRYFKKEK